MAGRISQKSKAVGYSAETGRAGWDMRVAKKRPGSSWWTVMRGQTSMAHACSISTSAPHPGVAKSKVWPRTCSAMALARSTRPFRRPTAWADSALRRASRRAAGAQPEGSEATAELGTLNFRLTSS